MNLKRWDVILVSSSAGKDSGALLSEVCELAAAQGVLDRVHVVHCDLGDRVEWPGVKELAAEHCGRYGVPLHVVRRPQGDLLDQVLARGMWPSSKARYCTSDHKRGQVAPLITRLVRTLPRRHGWRRVVRTVRGRVAADVRRVPRRARVLQCLGHRAGESPDRAAMPVFERDARNTNGRRLVGIWRPLHAWNLLDVFARNLSRGLRLHQAYHLGMPRLSCALCIFSPRAGLILAARHNPAILDAYVDVERRTGHAFRVGLPILDIKRAVDAGEQGGPVESWCM